jgi:hypothetical protein
MRHLRLILAAAITACALVVAWMLWAAAPVGAPVASDGSSPGESPGRAVPPAVAAWRTVNWLPPTNDPLGPSDPLRRIDGLIGGEDGLIGWGRAPLERGDQVTDSGAVFLSDDGMAWTTVPVGDGVGPQNTSSIHHLATGPRGYLAVGSVCCTPDELALWRSPNGLAWERIAPGGLDPTIHVPTSVAALPDGWLLVGMSRVEPGSTIWRSDDGEAWEPVLEVDEAGSWPAIGAVVTPPTGFVAVGTVVGDGGTYDGAVWSSSDGRTWERIAVDDPALVGEGEVQLYRAWSHAGGLLATGLLGTADQRRECEDLVGMVASLDHRPPVRPLDATSCQPGEERTWASTDGRVWQRIDPGAGAGPQPTEFRVITAGGPGLVLLGESSMPASPDTMLYTSPDGVTWTALDDGVPMLDDVAVGLVVRGGSIVAVTEHWAAARSTLRIWLGRAE